MSRSEGVSVMRSRSVLDQAWELFHELAPDCDFSGLSPSRRDDGTAGYRAVAAAEWLGAVTTAAVAFDLEPSRLVADLAWRLQRTRQREAEEDRAALAAARERARSAGAPDFGAHWVAVPPRRRSWQLAAFQRALGELEEVWSDG